MATVAMNKPASSGQQQSEWLGKALEDVAKSFNKNLNALEAEAHLEAWSALVRKVGRPQFERALKRAIAESQFFPKLEAISSRIPSGMRLMGVADPNCKKCDGTSWERVFSRLTVGPEDSPEKAVDPRFGAVRRCSCWRKVEATN